MQIEPLKLQVELIKYPSYLTYNKYIIFCQETQTEEAYRVWFEWRKKLVELPKYTGNHYIFKYGHGAKRK